MKFLIFVPLLVLIGSCLKLGSKEVRKPAVAGMFYPGEKNQLQKMVSSYLKKADVSPVGEEVFALISPHAGFIYSGPVAAYGYRLLQQSPAETVILIGPSHRVHLPGIAVYPTGAFATPLGQVEIDEELAQKIIKSSPYIQADTSPHQPEHSLEVQLPFLQEVLKNFKIVPILINDVGKSETLAEAIIKNIGDKKVVLIASTDLSHYLPYKEARALDLEAISWLEEFSLSALSKTEGRLCGLAATISVLHAAQKLNYYQTQLLKYANSGDTAGDKKQVVGYCSLAIYKNQRKKKESVKGWLNQQEQETLLKIARQSIEEFFKGNKKFSPGQVKGALQEKRGVFVTLTKAGNLRGCIGYLKGYKPLAEAVAEMALSAAFRDSRFPPLKEEELGEIEIEISVLTPFQKIKKIEEIKVGQHGLYIKKGFQSGLLLPQVATKYGWDREKFLEQVCLKAGLSPESWQEKDAELYIFSAQIFHE